jgi:transposase
MTYSKDFRQKALAIRKEEGLSIEETAIRFGVGKSSITRWLKRLEAKETRNSPARKIDMEALKQEVEDNPEAYQYERAKRFGVCQAAIGKALKRLKISYKKNAVTSESGRKRTGSISKQDKAISSGQ